MAQTVIYTNTIEDYNLLTIIIPTYNRCQQVEKNIRLIIPQVCRNRNKVRLYISDNASTDGTDKMVIQYLKQYPDNIFYYKQSKNITASPNFNHAVHAVNSEYVYILGDDDYVIPTFVEIVLSLIEEYPDVGLFHFNYILGLKRMKKCKVFQSEFTSSMIKLYPSGKEFIWEQLNSPSFVSSSLFKRQVWLDGTPYMKNDCSGYVWLSILLHGCLKYKCLYYQVPMLVQNFPEDCPYSANWPFYYITGLGNLFNYLDEYIPGIYEHWRDYQQKRDWITFFIVISGIIDAKKTYKTKGKDVLIHIKYKIARLFFSLCLYCMPSFCKWPIVTFIRAFRIKSKI